MSVRQKCCTLPGALVRFIGTNPWHTAIRLWITNRHHEGLQRNFADSINHTTRTQQNYGMRGLGVLEVIQFENYRFISQYAASDLPEQLEQRSRAGTGTGRSSQQVHRHQSLSAQLLLRRLARHAARIGSESPGRNLCFSYQRQAVSSVLAKEDNQRPKERRRQVLPPHRRGIIAITSDRQWFQFNQDDTSLPLLKRWCPVQVRRKLFAQRNRLCQDHLVDEKSHTTWLASVRCHKQAISSRLSVSHGNRLAMTNRQKAGPNVRATASTTPFYGMFGLPQQVDGGQMTKTEVNGLLSLAAPCDCHGFPSRTCSEYDGL